MVLLFSEPPMSISTTTSDCSLAFRTRTKTKATIFSTPSKILHFAIFPITSNLANIKVNSSSSSSPAVQDVLSRIELENYSQQTAAPDPKNFDNFLCELLQDPQTQELAYEYYVKAKESPGFRPDKATLKLLIRYLIESKEWGLIASLPDDFKTYNVFPDAYTCSKLVTSCIRARKFSSINTLIDQMLEENGGISLLVFDSAMRGYNKLHMYTSTISLYRRMKSAGIGLDSSCYCQIMEAYYRTGETDQVLRLFYEFEKRKTGASVGVLRKIYRILCESLGKSGRAFEALELFRKSGNIEDSYVYASLICSFASIREANLAEELFKEAEEKGMLKDPEVFLKLVLMYVEEGSLEKTLEVVETMAAVGLTVSDCVLCAVVNGFSKKRGFGAAVKVYEKLVSQGCAPGQVTYASVMNAYCRVGLYSKAEMVFEEMQEKGFDKCVVAYSSMVAMYGKTGRTRDAMRLVAKMKRNKCEPNVWVYNSLMDMHGREKNIRQVEKVWKEMKRKNVRPDKVSYTTAISAYNKAREFECCVRLFSEFKMNGGIVDRAMAGIMVGVFSKLSRIDELVKLLTDMKSQGTKLDDRLYYSAFNALRDAGLHLQCQWLRENFERT